MHLQVITKDGRRGEIATTVLEANAFRPVVVQFPEGDQQPYFLRELQIDEPPSDQRKQSA
jgi:hypothetical protein